MPRRNGKSSVVAHSQSTPQLPPRVATDFDPRVGLAASVSATALQPLPTNDPTESQAPSFRITDILPTTDAGARDDASVARSASIRPTRKRPKPTGAVGGSLLPLSPIRSGTNGSNDDSYVRRLDAPESPELFAYASALCHRVTGRYMARDVLQRDPDAQRQEIQRIQRDPELLHAISAIQVLGFISLSLSLSLSL
ncbi:hypothetical protein PINS_up010789 [Pythium insidiosum]|nr:hypothetical protein PINS_up010789 [Pythium insidiosum]